MSMAACIAEGRLAPANGRNPDREQLLFALSWSQKWRQKPAPKTGAAILPEEGKASKMAAPFLGPGCCIHRQTPSACSEYRDSGTFRLFSLQ